MSIGSRLDTLIGDALVAAGRIADKALTRLTPPDFDEHAARQFLSGAEQLADLEADEDVYEPVGEHPDIADTEFWWHETPTTSVPGQPSCSPVAAERPGPESPSGPGHSTSDLLTAAANQLEQWRRCHTDNAVRYGYLTELIPELRDRAAQYAAIND